MPDFLSQLVKRRNVEPLYLDDPNEEDSELPLAARAEKLEQPPEILNAIRYIIDSGLFDAEFYLANYPDIAKAGVDPFNHFFHYGFQEGRCPNPYFDPLWYLETNPGVRNDQLQPLLHYVVVGDREGRRPSVKFDAAWYRERYTIGLTENALAHYLSHRTTGRFSPIPDFDVEYYLKNCPDVAAAGIDPFEHFVSYG